MKKIVVAILLSLLPIPASFAQTRSSDHNTIGWYNAIITPGITKKLSGHIEYQWRRDNLITDWQQSLLRVGLTYKVHPMASVHLGYAWILTYPYGDYSIARIPKTFPEHRIYEQLIINNTVGKVTVQQRLRLEQRWLGRLDSVSSETPDTWVYVNRGRYMLRADVPVYKNLYIAAYDEIFIQFGKNVAENVFDQNRISGLVGYKFNKTVRAEAGYLNQTAQLGREIGGKNMFQYNSGLIVNVYVNVNTK